MESLTIKDDSPPPQRPQPQSGHSSDTQATPKPNGQDEAAQTNGHSTLTTQPGPDDHPSKPDDTQDSQDAKDSKDSKGATDEKDDKPAGGRDRTPMPPHSEPTYTLLITFHSATHLPWADISSLSSDPYILAQLNTALPTRNKDDPCLRFRGRTVHNTLNPEWEERWVVAGVPESGGTLKVRIYDEDRRDKDDRLGGEHIHLPVVGNVERGWKDIHRHPYKIQKRRASKRVNTIRLLRSFLPSGHTPKDGEGGHHENLIISIECLGRTKDEDEVGKIYTVGPCNWRKHFSPVLGRMMGMKDGEEGEKGEEGGEGETGDGGKGKTQRFNFEANEMQLRGPVPNDLYHRYVEFKSFVFGMFNATGLRGRVLHRVLHTQHERIYGYDKMTEYGTFEEPCEEMGRRFLEMCHWDEGGRLFTFVVTRFCETGKEFSIDLLSKHTMHADVDRYIAWSGEFLIRRLAKPGTEKAGTHPADSLPNGPPKSSPPRDIKHYELIIDNDSGTYRPDKELIPVFQSFLEKSFPGLKIVVMDGFDEKLKKIKDEQYKAKLKEGKNTAVVQGSDTGSDAGSFSSSDEEDLDEMEAEREKERKSAAGGMGKMGKAVEMLETPKVALKNMLPGK